MQLINFHCHLANIESIEGFLDSSSDIYISNALDDRALEQHLLIQKNNFCITTGQHPLYPHSSITEERVIKLLEQNMLFAVGEIGFDKRNSDFEWQKEIFLKFCDIANQFHKPVIIHCVGYYYDLLAIIKKNFPNLLYILHSFQGSIDITKEYSKLNVIFSLHHNIVKIKNSRNVLSEIFNNHNYVFETDEDASNTHDVSKTIEEISIFCDRDEDEMIEKQSEVWAKCNIPLA